MKPLVFLALWLWPSSLLAYPTLTVSPDEEENLNHYVQVLQNLMLSVPTREQGQDGSKSTTNAEVTGSQSSQPEVVTTSAQASASSSAKTVSAATADGDSAPLASRGFSLGPGRKRHTTTSSTAFWSIRPNNVSVVLRTQEPYIEKEEPEPEPATTSRSPLTTSSTSPRVTRVTVVKTRSTHVDMSTDSEDVPQLSGTSGAESLAEEPRAQALSNSDILRKISDLRALVQRPPAPPADRHDPEYRAFVRSSREHLKRSLALAAAAEHRLQKMYRSNVFPEEEPTSDEIDDVATVINMLYNSRSKLPDYLDITYVPSEMKGRASSVVQTLRKALCIGQVETQSLIRKLLNNNMKILNLLEVP